MEKVAVYESEKSYKELYFIEVSTLTLAVQQLLKNELLYGIHKDPLGNLIAVDIDGNRYPAVN